MVERFGREAVDVSTVIDAYMFDSSWRMRYVFSESMDKLAPFLDMQTALTYYTDLLQDGEAEVRISACRRLSDLVQIFDSESFECQVLPLL
jgi:hypothetical protein